MDSALDQALLTEINNAFPSMHNSGDTYHFGEASSTGWGAAIPRSTARMHLGSLLNLVCIHKIVSPPKDRLISSSALNVGTDVDNQASPKLQHCWSAAIKPALNSAGNWA